MQRYNENIINRSDFNDNRNIYYSFFASLKEITVPVFMKEKYTCILVDDELDALDGIELLLLNTGKIKIIEKIQNSENATEKIQQAQPDLVFLDIDMPVKDGFEVLEEINNAEINTKVIFVTAFNQYILKALRNSAFDYLTKPIDRLELNNVIKRFDEDFNTNQPNRNISLKELNMIKIPANYGCIFLKKDDIIYLEADGNYTKIHSTESSEISSQNLGKFETQLQDNNFIRISKSLIINSLHIKKFDKKNKKCILFCNDKEYNLTISRRKLNIFDNL